MRSSARARKLVWLRLCADQVLVDRSKDEYRNCSRPADSSDHWFAGCDLVWDLQNPQVVSEVVRACYLYVDGMLYRRTRKRASGCPTASGFPALSPIKVREGSQTYRPLSVVCVEREIFVLSDDKIV